MVLVTLGKSGNKINYMNYLYYSISQTNAQ